MDLAVQTVPHQYMSTHLKKNMYAIEYDTLIENVQPCSDDQVASMRYSCEYWVDHLRLAFLSRICRADVPGIVAISPDNRTVALIFSEIVFCDIASGSNRKFPVPLDNGKIPPTIHFSEDGQYLHTCQGWTVSMSGELVPISNVGRQPSPMFYIDKGWVMRDGKRKLWLPSEHNRQLFAASGNNVVLMDRNGRFMMLDLD